MNNKVYKLVNRFQKKYFGTIAFRLKHHSKVVSDHLNSDEKLIYAFCGQKGYSHKEIFSTCVVALTDKRIIVATKRVFWGYFFTTITPDMFNDLKIQSGILFGRVILDTVDEEICISNLSKKSLYEIETAISTYVTKEETIELKKKNKIK